MSDLGHVSNEDAALALGDVIQDKQVDIYLAHLSLDNNMKDLARMTVKQVLEQEGHRVGESIQIYDTDPNQPTALSVV